MIWAPELTPRVFQAQANLAAVGTVRHHVCADDKDDLRAERDRARCKSYYDANRKQILAQRKAARNGSGWAKGMQFAPRTPCQQCGKPFYAPPSYKKRGQGKFCGRKCWIESRR